MKNKKTLFSKIKMNSNSINKNIKYLQNKSNK